MSELSTIIGILSNMSGEDFIVIGDAEQHLDLDLRLIVTAGATVFDEIVTVDNVDIVPAKGMTGIEFSAGSLFPLKRSHAKIVTLTSGVIIGYK